MSKISSLIFSNSPYRHHSAMMLLGGKVSLKQVVVEHIRTYHTCHRTYPVFNSRKNLDQILSDLANVILNKGECDLNQSKDNSFVKRVAKNDN